MKRTLFAGSISMVALVVGCGGSGTSGSATGSGGGAASGLTYYKDAKPIFDAKCGTCHVAGGIAPFTTSTFAAASPFAGLIKQKVADKTMPPWLADDACADYVADRSLSQAQIDTLVKWVDDGAVEGDPKDEGAPIDTGPDYALSRVDLNLPMPVDYTAQTEPDDYRCFVIDWPKDTVSFVTGFRANPGNPKVVHHVIAFLAAPDQAADAKALDDAEAGPGYTCFGGTGLGAKQEWIGAWAPGSAGTDYPAGTGIRIEPGSKIVLQVHYNTLTAGKQSDKTSIDFKIDNKVDKEAHIQPWTNPSWVTSQSMKIAAFDADANHAWTFDPTPYISGGKPFTMYSANLHMHTLGTSAKLSIMRQGGAEECMLEIPRWNFHWQGSYGFAQPKIMNPGDQLFLECHWDNSPKNQPSIGGKQQMPKDVFWGEGTTDEMCLGGFYMTE